MESTETMLFFLKVMPSVYSSVQKPKDAFMMVRVHIDVAVVVILFHFEKRTIIASRYKIQEDNQFPKYLQGKYI